MGKLVICRRGLLGAGVGLTAMSLIGARAARAEGERIRMMGWGSEDRATRTKKAAKLFEEDNAGTGVESEFMGWDDYWPRLATQVAGGNAPDLLQMDYRYLFEYARRGAILPLDPYLGGVLRLDDFGKANIDSCSVDGKLYGVNLGVNAFGVIFDGAAWQEAGVEPPTYGTTWEDFAGKCVAFSKAKKRRNFFAVADGSGSSSLFECWLLEQGKSLFTDKGDLGHDADDITKWFKYWEDIRAAGGCVPADVQALYKNTIDTSPLTLGRAASDYAFSNQFVGFQKVNKLPLTITAQPVIAGGKPGHFLKPSQMLSVSAKSKVPEAAASLANFLVRDPRGTIILGVERGVPASAQVRETLRPMLDYASGKAVDFISKLAPYIGSLPPTPPQGAGEMDAVLIRTSQEVAFKSVTPRQGAEKLVAEAKNILKRG